VFILISLVYHDEFREIAKGLACARSVASRSVLRARFIPHGIDAERRRRIPMAIVETSAPRNQSRPGKCGSKTIALEK
jgi:hypothetical protein